MVDDELAELRRRRLEQMQRQAMEQQAVEEELARQQQMAAQIRTVLMEILEPEARERLNTIKLTRPDFAKAVDSSWLCWPRAGGSGNGSPMNS